MSVAERPAAERPALITVENVSQVFSLSHKESTNLSNCISRYSEKGPLYIIFRIWNAVKKLFCCKSDWENSLNLLTNKMTQNNFCSRFFYAPTLALQYPAAFDKEKVIAEFLVRALIVVSCNRQMHHFARNRLDLDLNEKTIQNLTLNEAIDRSIFGNGRSLQTISLENISAVFSLALGFYKEKLNQLESLVVRLENSLVNKWNNSVFALAREMNVEVNNEGMIPTLRTTVDAGKSLLPQFNQALNHPNYLSLGVVRKGNLKLIEIWNSTAVLRQPLAFI